MNLRKAILLKINFSAFLTMKEDNLFRSVIAAIPDKLMEVPTMDASLYIKQAENLANWSKQDEKILVESGLPQGFINQIFERARFYHMAETLWKDENTTLNDIRQNWDLILNEADNYKTDLLCAFAQGFKLAGKPPEILNNFILNYCDADITSQLKQLVQLCDVYFEEVESLEFNKEKIEKANNIAEELETMQGYLETQSKKSMEYELIRNKAYTYLKLAVENVRAFGKFALWRSPERLIGYKIADSC